MTNDSSRRESAVHGMNEKLLVDDALEGTYAAMISSSASRIFKAKGCPINPDNFVKTLFGSLGDTLTYNSSVYTIGEYLRIYSRKLALEYSELTASGFCSDAYVKYTTEDVAKKADRLSLKERILFSLYFICYYDIIDIAELLRKTTDYIEKKVNGLTRRLLGRQRDISSDQARRILRSLCDQLDEKRLASLFFLLDKEAAHSYPSFKDSKLRKSAAVMLFLFSSGMIVILFNLEPTFTFLRSVDFLPAEWFIPTPDPVYELLVSMEKKSVQLPEGTYIIDSVVMMPDSDGLLTVEMYIIAPFKYDNETESIMAISDLYGHIPECTILSPYKKTKQSSSVMTVMDDMTCVIKYIFTKIDYTETVLINIDEFMLDYTLFKFSDIDGYKSVKWPEDRGVSLSALPVPGSDYVFAYTVQEATNGVEDSSYGMAGIVTDIEGNEFEFDFYTTEMDNGGSILMRSKIAQKVQSLSVLKIYKYYLYKEDNWFSFAIPNPPSGGDENINMSFSYRGIDYNISKVYRHSIGILDLYLNITPSPQSSPTDMCETINMYCEYATHSKYDKTNGIYRFMNIGYAPNLVLISIVSQIITTSGKWTINYPS